jgi:hypothetical protein
MEVITINNIEYYKGDDLLTHAPIFCKKSRTARELIKHKNIENTIYAKYVNDEWIQTDGKSKKFDKIFIPKSYCVSIPELNANVEETITDENGIEKAPEIIYLNDNEKFKDENGNILAIETRGERKVDNIYFKVKDVENAFGITQLYATFIEKTSSYQKNIDYKHFICKKNNNLNKIPDRETIKKTLFLTYSGILRVLFTTRNNKTAPFIKWAVETLFTIQMGTPENKNSLISKIKGVSYNTIQELFNVNARKIPCVYLTVFNNVKTLRTKMNIPEQYNDDDYVYKFGLTHSFEQRKNGHKSEYKDIEDCIEMKLVQFAYIDPLFLTDAEIYIKNLFKENIIEYKKHTEIVILSKKEFPHIKNSFELIARKYSGHNEELLQEIQQLKNENLTLELKYTQKIELMQTQMQYEKQEYMMKSKYEFENAMLKKNNECELLLAKQELEIYKNLYKNKNI